MSFNKKSAYGRYLVLLTTLLTLLGCAHAGDQSPANRLERLAESNVKMLVAIDENGEVADVVDIKLQHVEPCRLCEKKDEEKWGLHCKDLVYAAKEDPEIFQKEGICRGLVNATTKNQEHIGVNKTHANPTCISCMTSRGIREICW
ncbi:MAG: hypothetical protein WBN08_15560 [Thiogranum sp.]